MDIVGPHPACQGYTHVFTIVDTTTRWPESILISDSTIQLMPEP